MSLFSFFRKKEPTSAAIAKERLQIIVAHGGRRPSSPDFLAQLQKDILEVVRKYIQVEEDQINLSLDRKEDCEVLELNIAIPDQTVKTTPRTRF